MTDKVKEVVVHDQPPEAVEPQVVEKTVYVQKKRPRFMLGLVLGVLIVAGATAFYASRQGSYRAAGASIDRGVNAAQNAVDDAAQRARAE